MLRRHPRAAVGVAVLVVLLVVVGVLGGWARTEPEGVLEVAPGTEVAAAPFRVTLSSASAVYEIDGDVADPGEEGGTPRAFVVVEGRLALDADASVSGGDLEELVRSDLTSTYSPFDEYQEVAIPVTVDVAADGSSLLGVGPGLAYDVRLVFELDEAAVPERVALTLDGQTWRKSALDGTPGWFDPAPVAVVSLDVAPLPAERPPPEEF